MALRLAPVAVTIAIININAKKYRRSEKAHAVMLFESFHGIRHALEDVSRWQILHQRVSWPSTWAVRLRPESVFQQYVLGQFLQPQHQRTQ